MGNLTHRTNFYNFLHTKFSLLLMELDGVISTKNSDPHACMIYSTAIRKYSILNQLQVLMAIWSTLSCPTGRMLSGRRTQLIYLPSANRLWYLLFHFWPKLVVISHTVCIHPKTENLSVLLINDLLQYNVYFIMLLMNILCSMLVRHGLWKKIFFERNDASIV